MDWGDVLCEIVNAVTLFVILCSSYLYKYTLQLWWSIFVFRQGMNDNG